LLSRLVFENKEPIEPLSSLYNWHMALGNNQEAEIIHWLGDPGKEYICLSLHHLI
jgi:hypothetical protein